MWGLQATVYQHLSQQAWASVDLHLLCLRLSPQSLLAGQLALSLVGQEGAEWSWAEKVYRQVHEREVPRGKERLGAEARAQPG